MKETERDPVKQAPTEDASPKAVITLTVEHEAGSTDDHAYIINAETEGLKGGEETLLAVLESYVAHLKESLGREKQ